MRPTTITVTTATMAILNFFNYAVLWDKQSWSERDVVLLFIGSTVVITIGYVVLWYYHQGQNWARLTVIFTSVVIFFNNYGAMKRANPIVKVVNVAEMIVAVFLVVWLNTPTAKAYFNRERASRLT